MASNIVKFCTAALAGSIIGITYERWPVVTSPMNRLEWPNLLGSVSASSSPPVLRPPFDDSISTRSGKNSLIPVDPRAAAEILSISSKYGLPSKDNIRLFNNFIISYDRRLRAPIWVMEHMNPQRLNGDGTRKRSEFVEDETIHEFFRASLEDFRYSGYDRGHMAAAANHKISQDAMDQTFILSNISPQVPEFNQGAWEVLESYVRWRAKQAKNLYCVTGPLFVPKKDEDGNVYVKYRVLGDNFVSVPTHYFKVILIESKNGTLTMEAFMMPNDKSMKRSVSLDKYRVPIERLDIIERASGVIFFDQLKRDKLDAPRSLPGDFKPKNYDSKTKVPSAA